MRKLGRLELILLQYIFSARGKLESFTLFKRSKVSFKEFSASLNKLRENDLLLVEGNLVVLSEKGKASATTKKPEMYYKPWRSIPAKFIVQQHPPNEPYIPSISMLDKRTFN